MGPSTSPRSTRPSSKCTIGTPNSRYAPSGLMFTSSPCTAPACTPIAGTVRGPAIRARDAAAGRRRAAASSPVRVTHRPSLKVKTSVTKPVGSSRRRRGAAKRVWKPV